MDINYRLASACAHLNARVFANIGYLAIVANGKQLLLRLKVVNANHRHNEGMPMQT